TQASGDRDTRRPWNPRWRGVESTHDQGTAAELEPQLSPEERADLALADRGITAADLVTPVDHRVPVADVVAQAHDNAVWWRGLSEAQQQALIETYPHEVGGAAGLPPLARHEANSRVLQQYLTHRDVLVSRRDNGVALNKTQEAFINRMNDI